MRRSSALGAFTLLLLPTQLPSALDVGGVGTVAADGLRRGLRAPLTVLEGTIARGSTLAQALSSRLPPASIHGLVEAARPTYDLARVAAGHPYGIVLGTDGLLTAFTYGIDELRTLHVQRNGEALEAKVVTREVETRVSRVEGEIRSSLFGAVNDAGEEDQLAVDLAEIFAWDVDFNTELQPGDAFRVAVEKRYVEGRLLGYGSILAAELARGERLLRAVRFEADGHTGYFTPDGRPMRKAFLRSPLKFTRISSGFTRARLHPILNVRRPHLGVDFAAPTGTPVRASADGVVVGAGWSGGFGNLVHIRHSSGFETMYGHLSRIHVRPGQKVDQGTLIGAVGSTGLSTAPHLDYRVKKGGQFVNPVKMVPPPPEPVAAALRPAFDRTCAERLALLAAAAGVQVAGAKSLDAPRRNP